MKLKFSYNNIQKIFVYNIRKWKTPEKNSLMFFSFLFQKLQSFHKILDPKPPKNLLINLKILNHLSPFSPALPKCPKNRFHKPKHIDPTIIAIILPTNFVYNFYINSLLFLYLFFLYWVLLLKGSHLGEPFN